jgi:integrase
VRRGAVGGAVSSVARGLGARMPPPARVATTKRSGAAWLLTCAHGPDAARCDGLTHRSSRSGPARPQERDAKHSFLEWPRAPGVAPAPTGKPEGRLFSSCQGAGRRCWRLASRAWVERAAAAAETSASRRMHTCSDSHRLRAANDGIDARIPQAYLGHAISRTPHVMRG